MALPPQLVLRTAQTGPLNPQGHGIERMVSVPARRSTDGSNFERTSPSTAYRPVAARPVQAGTAALPQPMDGRPRVIHASHVAPPGQWSSPRMAPLSSTNRTQLQQHCASSPRPIQEGLDLLSRSSRELQVPGPMMGLYTNARASLVTGAPLWSGSAPLSPRVTAVVSPRGQYVAYQAERPGNSLWEQHRLQAMQQLRRSGVGEVQQVQQLPHPGGAGALEPDPSQRYIMAAKQGHHGLSPVSTENLGPLELSTKRVVVAESVHPSANPSGADQSGPPKQGSGPSPPRECESSRQPLAEEEPLQTTSQLVDETSTTIASAPAAAAPSSAGEVQEVPVTQVDAEKASRDAEEPSLKTTFDSPRDACNKTTAKASELLDRIAQLEAQVSDRANLIAHINRQQAQLDRLEALAEENASLRSQLRNRRGVAKGDTPPMSARGELSRERGAVETPTMARRFRTAPGEVQTHSDAPVVLTARSPRPSAEAEAGPKGKVAMVEKTLAELEKALGLQASQGNKQIIFET